MMLAVVLPGPAGAQAADAGITAAAEPAAPTRQADREADRRIAEAATWRVDPRLLRARPTDSAGTAAAREQLAALSVRVRQRLAEYDAARARALDAAASARSARARLRSAREELRQARLDFLARKDLLITVLTTSYVSTQLAPLSLVLTSDGEGDVVGDLTRLEEMSRSQAAAVVAAELARERLHAAEVAAEAAEQKATAELATARVAAARADQRRQAVLTAARAAQSLVETSVLADLAARAAMADGYDGGIVFPLAPGTAFLDQDNYGGRGHRWASRHTGDDLSASCGSGVVAATAGTVMVRTDQAWAGQWLVLVSTAEGSLTTWYAHLQTLDVEDGQLVRAGDPLGQVGQLGNASGCHLHFEVHPTGGGIYEDGIDPSSWLVEMGAYPGL